MDVLYHPVTTPRRDAQELFNLGLFATYAFNHDEAYRAFESAAQKDPDLAMAYWGMALVLGKNINRNPTAEDLQRAYSHIQTAVSLAARASENEQAYIHALAMRYSSDPNADQSELDVAYARAMRQVHLEFPEDLDAAVLYAESLMDIAPWDWWSPDGQPKIHTPEMVHLLETVLSANPTHVGANHYYIHAVEESKHPEWALPSANRLISLGAPKWGHLLHMPSHIFMLLGDYDRVVRVNLEAVKADKEYLKTYGTKGNYPIHYLGHNLSLLSRGYLWQERYQDALAIANEMYALILPHAAHMSEMIHYLAFPMQTHLYFHRWNEILKMDAPPADVPYLTAFWHFARALSFASTGRLAEAQEEREIFLSQKATGENEVFEVAREVLDAAISHLNQDELQRLEHLRRAVGAADNLPYNEPPSWYYPVRQTLGAALLEAGHAEEAEAVFREVLQVWRRNGRSLFGLQLVLRQQGRDLDAYWVEREANTALRSAEQPLQLGDL